MTQRLHSHQQHEKTPQHLAPAMVHDFTNSIVVEQSLLSSCRLDEGDQQKSKPAFAQELKKHKTYTTK